MKEVLSMLSALALLTIFHFASGLSKDEKIGVDALCAAIPSACVSNYKSDYCANLAIIKCRCPGFTACPSSYANSSQQYVTEISFSGTGATLTGFLPTELGMLSSLGVIDLGSQSISGTIPSELGLTKLYAFNLQRNQISGTIPTDLARLDLLGLQLSSNSITGSIPSGVFKSKLQIMELAGNKITGSIPTEIGSCTSLLVLSAGRNLLTGTIPSEIGLCKSLRELDLNTNLLTGAIPTEIGRIPELSNIAINNNLLSGTLPTELGNLRPVPQSYMILGNNSFTGTIPSELGRFANISQLAIYGVPGLTGSIPSEFGSLSSAMFLWLSDNSLVGTIPAQLASASKLTSLRLQNNLLFGRVPSLPQFSKSVEELELYLQGNFFNSSIQDLNLGGSVDFNCSSTFMTPTGLCQPKTCPGSQFESPGLEPGGLCFEGGSRLRGVLRLNPAIDETCISGYQIFFSSGNNLVLIANVPKRPRTSDGFVTVTIDNNGGAGASDVVVYPAQYQSQHATTSVKFALSSLPTNCDGVLPSSSPTPSPKYASQSATRSLFPVASRSPSSSLQASRTPVPTRAGDSSGGKKKDNSATIAISVVVVVGAVVAGVVGFVCYRRRRTHSRFMARVQPSKNAYEDTDL